MTTAYLWAPWLLVAAIFAGLLYTGRRTLDARRLAKEVALVVTAYAAYFVVRGVTQGGTDTAISHGLDIAHAERVLHVYWEPRMADFVAGREALASAANWIYIWGHWPLILLVAVWLFLHRPDDYRVYRNAFVISGALGLVGFLSYPVAPPRISDPAAFVDTLARYSTAYRSLEPAAFVNQYAAMPSIHVGWNLLVGIALVTTVRSWPVRVFGALVPVSMALAVIVTGNHFILDIVAGAAVCLASLAVARALARGSFPAVHRS